MMKKCTVGQEFHPKTRLFEAMVGMADKLKMHNFLYLRKNLKLEFSGGQVSCMRV